MVDQMLMRSLWAWKAFPINEFTISDFILLLKDQIKDYHALWTKSLLIIQQRTGYKTERLCPRVRQVSGLSKNVFTAAVLLFPIDRSATDLSRVIHIDNKTLSLGFLRCWQTLSLSWTCLPRTLDIWCWSHVFSTLLSLLLHPII